MFIPVNFSNTLRLGTQLPSGNIAETTMCLICVGELSFLVKNKKSYGPNYSTTKI